MFFKKSKGKQERSAPSAKPRSDLAFKSAAAAADTIAASPEVKAEKDSARETRQYKGETASILVSDLSEMVSPSGRAATGTMISGWCGLGPSQGGRSAIALPAAENDTFRATATVTLLKENTNSFSSPYFFGPLFFDKDGTVIRWWKPFDMPVAGESAEISVEAAAPPGTHSVRLGVNGTYNAKGETGDYVVGIASAKLTRVTAD